MTIENQIKNFISYGFHKYLGMTETEYMNSVSVNVIQPEKYQGIFDYPFFVETRIPIEEQIKLLGIDDYVNAANLTHLYEQINFPYLAWTHDLSLHAGKTISETHSSYLEIEIGEKDTKDIKIVFGRGQNFGDWDKSRLEINKKEIELQGFEIIFAKDYEYNEYYSTKEDLDTFLQSVPIFEDFDSIKDKELLNKLSPGLRKLIVLEDEKKSKFMELIMTLRMGRA